MRVFSAARGRLGLSAVPLAFYRRGFLEGAATYTSARNARIAGHFIRSDFAVGRHVERRAGQAVLMDDFQGLDGRYGDGAENKRRSLHGHGWEGARHF